VVDILLVKCTWLRYSPSYMPSALLMVFILFLHLISLPSGGVGYCERMLINAVVSPHVGDLWMFLSAHQWCTVKAATILSVPEAWQHYLVIFRLNISMQNVHTINRRDDLRRRATAWKQFVCLTMLGSILLGLCLERRKW